MRTSSRRHWLPLVVAATTGVAAVAAQPAASSAGRRTMLVGIGDSLTQGTADATNINIVTTSHAYFERVAQALQRVIPLAYSQPYLTPGAPVRIAPLQIPSNLGVDGADVFSIAGLAYGKRSGADRDRLSPALLATQVLPEALGNKHERVIYPINQLTGGTASVVDAAIWLLDQGTAFGGIDRAIAVTSIGANDAAAPALGLTEAIPLRLPLPLAEIAPELWPLLVPLLRLGELTGMVEFDPFTMPQIQASLTETTDFGRQLAAVFDRLQSEVNPAVEVHHFLATQGRASSLGYLIDSEDIEFYLRKRVPGYSVPPSFARVAPPGTPITEPLRGDRIALVTFSLMFFLADSGYSADYLNRVLETADGRQRDGLVLSEAELEVIDARIDQLNDIIRAEVAARGPRFHLIDIARTFDGISAGTTPVVVNGRPLTRKWTRGGGQSLDGAHPSHTGHALAANVALDRINSMLGIQAPLHDLDAIQRTDPYFDADGDGWAPGPTYARTPSSAVLFLLVDRDDTDPSVGAVLPPNVWEIFSRVVLEAALSL